MGGLTMRRLILIAVATMSVVTLQGCVGTAIRAQTNQSNCAAYGFVKGTPEFADCMLRLEQSAQVRGGLIGAALIQNRPQSYSCTSTRVYNSTQTNCR